MKVEQGNPVLSQFKFPVQHTTQYLVVCFALKKSDAQHSYADCPSLREGSTQTHSSCCTQPPPAHPSTTPPPPADPSSNPPPPRAGPSSPPPAGPCSTPPPPPSGPCSTPPPPPAGPSSTPPPPPVGPSSSSPLSPTGPSSAPPPAGPSSTPPPPPAHLSSTLSLPVQPCFTSTPILNPTRQGEDIRILTPLSDNIPLSIAGLSVIGEKSKSSKSPDVDTHCYVNNEDSAQQLSEQAISLDFELQINNDERFSPDKPSPSNQNGESVSNGSMSARTESSTLTVGMSKTKLTNSAPFDKQLTSNCNKSFT